MKIFGEICSIGDSVLVLYIMILIAKNIYYEKINLSRKQWVIISIIVLCINALLQIYDLEDVQVLVDLSIFNFIIFLFRKKKTIKSMFLFIPIMGLSISLSTIFFMAIAIISQKSFEEIIDNNIYSFFSSLFILAVILIFIRIENNRSRKYFGNIEMNFQNFELSRIERNIISCNGFVLLILFGILFDIDDFGILKNYKWKVTAFNVVSAVLMLSTVLVMLRKSVTTNYYKNLSQINKHYLEAQLKHFQLYRKSQTETRRIRHDMKNHLLCMKNLYDSGEFEELGQYIYKLNNTVQNINKEIYIGNDIADAIINEKNEIAKHMGIEINIEGNLNGIKSFNPIDVCTIFANALDNSLEALKEVKVDNPIINISIKKNKNYVLISFMNAVNEMELTYDGKKYKTNKNDRQNHGFGLENIKRAAEKYKGSLSYSIMDYKGIGKVFCTEVMMKI